MAHKSQTPNANKKILDSRANVLRLSNVNGKGARDTQQGSPKMSKQQQRQNVFFQIVVDHLFGFLHNSAKEKVEDLFYLDKKGKKIISAELNLENLFKATQRQHFWRF